MSGLWYLTVRTHGSAPARIAFPLSLISPISTLYFLDSGGIIPDMNFGIFTILGVLTLLFSGFFEIFPWNYKLLVWTGWLLVLEIIVHYVYLPINSRPSYHTVAKGSIILATFEATATLLFLIIFLDLLPIG